MNKKQLRMSFRNSSVEGRAQLAEFLSELVLSRRVASPGGLMSVLRTGAELLGAAGADQFAIADILEEIVQADAKFKPIADQTWPAGAERWMVKTIQAARKQRAA